MTDEAIMEAVKSGDLQQATLLFERYHKRIFNFLARMTPDKDLAEDLAQNVFLRMMKYRNSYRNDAKFQSWLFQIARNVFSDHYREKKSRYSGFVDVENIRDHLAESQEHATQEEKEALLMRSMARLTDDQREVLVLTRFQHMKYEEVAALLETSVANVKVRVHRALIRLREFYFELERI